MATSTAPDLSGSGRVDLTTRPVAAVRAAVANGSVGLNCHTTFILYVETWELNVNFYPSAGGLKKKEKKHGGTV